LYMDFEGVDVIIDETKKNVKCVSAYATLSTSFDSTDEVKRFVYKFIHATKNARKKSISTDYRKPMAIFYSNITIVTDYQSVVNVFEYKSCTCCGVYDDTHDLALIPYDYIDVVLDFDLGFCEFEAPKSLLVRHDTVVEPYLKSVVDAYVDYYFINNLGLKAQF